MLTRASKTALVSRHRFSRDDFTPGGAMNPTPAPIPNPNPRRPGSPHSKKQTPLPHQRQHNSASGSSQSNGALNPRHLSPASCVSRHNSALSTNPATAPIPNPTPTPRRPGSPHSKKQTPLPHQRQHNSASGSSQSNGALNPRHLSPASCVSRHNSALSTNPTTASIPNPTPTLRRPGSPHSKKQTPLPHQRQRNSASGSSQSNGAFRFEKGAVSTTHTTTRNLLSRPQKASITNNHSQTHPR